MERVLIRTCPKQTKEFFTCFQKYGKTQAKRCFPESVLMQECIDDEMNNMILVARGMN